MRNKFQLLIGLANFGVALFLITSFKLDILGVFIVLLNLTSSGIMIGIFITENLK